MRKDTNGFSLAVIVAVIAVVGVIGIGWMVFTRQSGRPTNPDSLSKPSTETDSAKPSEPTNQTVLKTADGISYSVPDGWKNVTTPFEPYENGDGNYLISPDYKEKGQGQLSIESGAFIHFTDVKWLGIGSETTVEQAAEIIKNNNEGYYLDKDSVKITEINSVKVIMYNSGHTTDGVTVKFKTNDQRWIEAGFDTVAGQHLQYDAQSSPHYPTFFAWVSEFVDLNK